MIAKYFVDFIIFSFLGWIYECIYCSCRTKHWQNRGFLFGPICPIYGSGAVAGMIIFGALPVFRDTPVPIWKIFLISAAASAILEYATSYVLEKLFHAVWWDYSKVPFNLHGRISLPTTTGFGLAGILIVKFLLPFVENLQAGISVMTSEILSLLLMAMLAADLALTVSSLTQLLQRIEAAQQEFNEKMENSYQIAQQGPRVTYAHMADAAKNAGVKVKEAGDKARHELAARLQERTGLLSNRELHHIRAISVFKRTGDKALILKFHDCLSRNLHRQEPM